MKISFHSLFRFLLLPGLFTASQACQAARTLEEPHGKTIIPPAASATTSETATPAVTPGPQPTLLRMSGLAGQVIAESDVGGQVDTPLADQMILAVRVEKAGEILGVSNEKLTEKELRFIRANLAQAKPGMTVTLSDASGKYTLLLDPGEYILCVADSVKTPPAFPATTRGCGRTQVREGEMRRVDISSGFGEILLVEKG